MVRHGHGAYSSRAFWKYIWSMGQPTNTHKGIFWPHLCVEYLKLKRNQMPNYADYINIQCRVVVGVDSLCTIADRKLSIDRALIVYMSTSCTYSILTHWHRASEWETHIRHTYLCRFHFIGRHLSHWVGTWNWAKSSIISDQPHTDSDEFPCGLFSHWTIADLHSIWKYCETRDFSCCSDELLSIGSHTRGGYSMSLCDICVQLSLKWYHDTFWRFRNTII